MRVYILQQCTAEPVIADTTDVGQMTKALQLFVTSEANVKGRNTTDMLGKSEIIGSDMLKLKDWLTSTDKDRSKLDEIKERIFVCNLFSTSPGLNASERQEQFGNKWL